MKAAVIERPNQLVIKEMPDPKCNRDEVILKVKMSSICNATDVHIWQGVFPPDACPPYPHILGHECSGEIIEVGKDVKGWAIGDRVGYWVKMTGAFGQFNAVRINNVAAARLTDEISDDESPVMEIVGGALRCMYNNGMQLGDVVVVLGQGPTGLVLMQLAKLFGASIVCGIDVFEGRLQKSRELGADITYNVQGKSQDQAREELREKLGKVDFIVDAMGNHRWKEGNSINLGLSLLRRGGTYQIWGHPTTDQMVNTRWISNENYIFRGFEPGRDISEKLIRYGVKLVASGRLNIKALITHKLPLNRLEEGLKLCRDYHEKTVKVLVDVNA